MIEGLSWEPENVEEEPFANITFPDGREFEVNRRNATLYTYLGKLAIYNHIYLCEVEEEEVTFATRIMKYTEGYEDLEEFMLDNEFPAVINQTVVIASDAQVYDKAVSKMGEVGDYVPDDWA